MALAVQIIGNGTTWHLNNTSGAPTSGGAATAAATSPFQVVDDSWTIQAAQPQTLYSGSPPLRNGSGLILRSWDNVTESFTLVCVGGTADTTASLIRTLTQLLNTALYATPCVLGIQPSGATSMMYTEVYSAVVQPTTSYLVNPVRGSSTVTLQITITRSPFFARLSAGETLINAATFTNTGTGANNNTQAYSAGAGDLIYEGQPLNIKLTPLVGFPSQFYLASVASRAYATTSAGTSTSASTTFGNLGPPTTSSVAALLTGRGLKVRVLARFSAMSTNTELQLYYGVGTNASQLSRPVRPGVNVAVLVDLGMISVPARLLASLTSGDNISITPRARSIDGLAISATLSYLEILLYYDFSIFATGNPAGVSGGNFIYVDSYVEKSSYPALPRSPVTAWHYSAASVLSDQLSIRGTPPRYFSGASLYTAWFFPGTAHSTTATSTVTVTHAPLYLTARGAG